MIGENDRHRRRAGALASAGLEDMANGAGAQGVPLQREGDSGERGILRFGFAPLYLRFVDVWDAVEILRDILATRAWDEPAFMARQAVT